MTAFDSFPLGQPAFVTNVLDVADRIEQGRRARVTPSDPTVLQELAAVYDSVNAKTLRESYHDAQQYKEELFTLFNLGHLSLEDRSKGEILYWQICEKIHRDLKNLKEVPEEFARTTVFCALREHAHNRVRVVLRMPNL